AVARQRAAHPSASTTVTVRAPSGTRQACSGPHCIMAPLSFSHSISPSLSLSLYFSPLSLSLYFSPLCLSLTHYFSPLSLSLTLFLPSLCLTLFLPISP